MKKKDCKRTDGLACRLFIVVALICFTTSLSVSADTYIDSDGYRYRLITDEYNGIYAELYAIIGNDVMPGVVNLPDYVYDNGVEYEVASITPGFLYKNYIYTIKGNNFVQLNHLEGSDNIYHIYIPEGQYVSSYSYKNLRSIEIEYASAGNVHLDSGFQFLSNISFSACDESCDGCWSNLTEINLGFRTQRISLDCGSGYKELTMRCAAAVPPEVWININGSVSLHVPIGTASAYRESENWQQLPIKEIIEDMDFGYNTVDNYVEVDGIYYSIMYDNSYSPYATVIGPVDRDCSMANISESLYLDQRYVPVKKISTCAFMDCKNLMSVYLPEGIEEIGDMAFYGCEGFGYNDDYGTVYSVTLPNTVKIVGKHAFDGVAVSPMMPESLRKINDYAFRGSFTGHYTFGYDDVILNEGLEYIGNNAFSCNNFLESIVIPSSVSHIGQYAFYDSFNLKEIVFRGNSIDFLRRLSMGYQSSYLEDFEIPSGVTSVSQAAGIRAKKITVGEDVRTFLPGSIYKTEEIWMLPDIPPTIYQTSYDTSLPELTLHVKKDCLSKYKSHPIWGLAGNIIADLDWVNVTQGDWTFKIDRFYKTAEVIGHNNASNATTIVIPSEISFDGIIYPVKTIGKWALSNIYSPTGSIETPTSIEIPASIKYIKNYAITYSYIDKIICKSSIPPTVNSKYPYAFK